MKPRRHYSLPLAHLHLKSKMDEAICAVALHQHQIVRAPLLFDLRHVVLCNLFLRLGYLLHANKKLFNEGDLRIASNSLNAFEVSAISRDHKSRM